MKKMALMLAVALMTLGLSTAFAATPSKTTTDVTQVKAVEVVKDDGTTATVDGFNLAVAEDDVQVSNEIAKIYDHIVKNGKTAVSYFPTETQTALSDVLGADVDVNKLNLNEFVTLKLYGYENIDGNVATTFTFTTKYEAGKKVAVVLGLYDAQSNVEWVVLNAEAQENGDLSVVFPNDVLAKMNNAAAVSMAVLSE